MLRRVAVVLCAVVLFGPVVAAAMPADPTWIGGMYDGGDADDSVALVWDQSFGLIPAVAVAELTGVSLVVSDSCPLAFAPDVSPSRDSRGPPRG